tara:strand:+ start:4070 stop:4219 length:150 start_codon:yes stop_codon:yes gene_type:complete
MRKVKLTESDCISVQHILKYYAYQNSESLDSEDKEAINKLANKFKSKYE